ncbi:MAG TPA: hypothetical protein PKE40_05005 [Arachnia sp.]|nr:hypothetical protein [Arachnia sp.]HMT85692.1 hypothetical protein [Arachnia sp.]
MSNSGPWDPAFSANAAGRQEYRRFFEKCVDLNGWEILEDRARPSPPRFREGDTLFVLRDPRSGKRACVETGLDYKRIDFEDGYTYGNLEEYPYREIELTEELLFLFKQYTLDLLKPRKKWFGEAELTCIAPDGIPVGVYMPRARSRYWNWDEYVDHWPDTSLRYK